jgi:hypothetical protein
MDAFESALEKDMAHLAQEVKMQRELPEMKSVSDEELVKNIVRSFPRLSANANEPQVPVPQPPSTASDSILPDYVQSSTPEVKLEIEYLIDVAFKNGIGKALDEAANSSPFIEDALRDALAGKLYPELQKRGIVK